MIWFEPILMTFTHTHNGHSLHIGSEIHDDDGYSRADHQKYHHYSFIHFVSLYGTEASQQQQQQQWTRMNEWMVHYVSKPTNQTNKQAMWMNDNDNNNFHHHHHKCRLKYSRMVNKKKIWFCLLDLCVYVKTNWLWNGSLPFDIYNTHLHFCFGIFGSIVMMMMVMMTNGQRPTITLAAIGRLRFEFFFSEWCKNLQPEWWTLLK